MADITQTAALEPLSRDAAHVTASKRYEQLALLRSPFLSRAREAARVTIPSLLPPEGAQGQKLYTPFQSVGSRGVNNLSAKLLLALLPPGEPFFKMVIDDFTLAELAETAGTSSEDIRGEFEKALNAVERAVMDRIEVIGLRTSLFETLKQLVVSGNALLQMREDRGARLWRLDEYVVKRDPSGEVLEIITQQRLSKASLPKKLLTLVQGSAEKAGNESVDDSIPLYTWVRRLDNEWEVRQEINDLLVPDSDGTFGLEDLPFLPLRYSRIDNEDYGRGLCDEYLGDLLTVEALSQAVVEWAGAAAKILFFVNPNGITVTSHVAKAPSGAFVEGDLRDIGVLQLEKFADFRVTKETLDQTERRLAAIFLLSSELPRDAERVTAEEIRLLASELEDTLGGTFSLFSQELQLPLVKLVMNEMTRKKKLPKLPKEQVKPKIVTGLEALGRTADLRRLDTLVSGVAALFPPDQLALYIDVGAYIKRRATALGIDMDGVVRTPEQVQALQQQAQMAALAQQVGPEVVRGVNDRAAGGQSQTGGQ